MEITDAVRDAVERACGVRLCDEAILREVEDWGDDPDFLVGEEQRMGQEIDRKQEELDELENALADLRVALAALQARA